MSLTLTGVIRIMLLDHADTSGGGRKASIARVNFLAGRPSFHNPQEAVPDPRLDRFLLLPSFFSKQLNALRSLSSPAFTMPTIRLAPRRPKRKARNTSRTVSDKSKECLVFAILPQELIDHVMSFLPPANLKITVIATEQDDQNQASSSETLAVNGNTWKKLLATKRVSKRFNKSITNAIRLAQRNHRTILIMELHTSHPSEVEFNGTPQLGKSSVPDDFIAQFFWLHLRLPFMFDSLVPVSDGLVALVCHINMAISVDVLPNIAPRLAHLERPKPVFNVTYASERSMGPAFWIHSLAGLRYELKGLELVEQKEKIRGIVRDFDGKPASLMAMKELRGEIEEVLMDLPRRGNVDLNLSVFGL
ncbi:uncharacterized protein MYCGRDRAFT_94813 [Zymoseptoria tritici IPO323]|uniref:F-box domain-containing protein n=1 Tax=Zymoseptoria tritici (strain CBS 115943 / IPO323) TaxID=336722 RepID=F9XF86_ZYMTI|nr:uncharacterized protein MYCGRDRAFT_94813 [Zymoseptoria tritici IPO323]EGP85887.1 hypothetical protein MYCGRDRAFT_94813 [Zymoseptoria tritici IPO323]